MHSPWGSIQHSTPFAPGFSSVSTAGHGGFRISETFARKQSIPADILAHAIKQGGYLWYEEDCDWAIPALVLEKYWPGIFQYALAKDPQYDCRASVIGTLSSTHPDLLFARGIEPDPKRYAHYLQEHQDARLRQQKHPAMINGAWGDWYTKEPGVGIVGTASGQYWRVCLASYRRMKKDLGVNWLYFVDVLGPATAPS